MSGIERLLEDINVTRRQITEEQEAAYRLCHHEHRGLTTEEASWCLGISVRAVQRLLRDMKAVAPHLFPLLSPNEWVAWKVFDCIGLGNDSTAVLLGISKDAAQKTLDRAKKKLGFHDVPSY